MKHPKYLTPAAASAAGQLLWIRISDINRAMAHVFMRRDGGIAWVGHGWASPLGSGHPCHTIQGEVRADGDQWLLTTEDEYLLEGSGGRPLVIRLSTANDRQGEPDGTRADARALLILDQKVELTTE